MAKWALGRTYKQCSNSSESRCAYDKAWNKNCNTTWVTCALWNWHRVFTRLMHLLTDHQQIFTVSICFYLQNKTEFFRLRFFCTHTHTLKLCTISIYITFFGLFCLLLFLFFFAQTRSVNSVLAIWTEEVGKLAKCEAWFVSVLLWYSTWCIRFLMSPLACDRTLKSRYWLVYWYPSMAMHLVCSHMFIPGISVYFWNTFVCF